MGALQAPALETRVVYQTVPGWLSLALEIWDWPHCLYVELTV